MESGAVPVNRSSSWATKRRVEFAITDSPMVALIPLGQKDPREVVTPRMGMRRCSRELQILRKREARRMLHRQQVWPQLEQ